MSVHSVILANPKPSNLPAVECDSRTSQMWPVGLQGLKSMVAGNARRLIPQNTSL